MILTVFAGIAEFERDLIRYRTSAGRVAAQKRMVKFGRPVKLNSDQRQIALQLIEEGKSPKQVASTFGIHPATVYRLKAGSDE